MSRFDLIIIGGGSAGMAAAIEAALSRMKVLVIDAAGVNYNKPCGEGIMPPGVRALRSLGVELTESAEISGLRIFGFAHRDIEVSFFAGRTGLGVRRAELRRAMWTRAAHLGVEIRTKTVAHISADHAGVVVDGERSRYLIFAGGSMGSMTVDITGSTKRDVAMRSGLRRHARLRPWSDEVEVYWADDFEVYVTPVSASEINVAVLSWKAIDFMTAVMSIPDLAARLATADWSDAVAGRAPMEHQSRWRKKNKIFICGDAAGFIDAMTGEGNTLALQSGITAVRMINSNMGFFYPLVWKALYFRYWILTTALRRMTRSAMTRRRTLDLFAKCPVLPRMAVWLLSM